MTQEDKELLLKDLCARLPYGVKVKTCLKTYTLKGLFDTEYGGVMGCLLGNSVPNKVSPKTVNHPLEQIKPYLFPLSSMTDEQLQDLGTYYAKDSKNIIDDAIKSLESPLVMYKAAHVCFNTLEWYNKNHFDYRGLLERGLALDATGLNVY